MNRVASMFAGLYDSVTIGLHIVHASMMVLCDIVK